MKLPALILPLLLTAQVHAQEAALQTEDQKTLYAVGVVLGRNVDPLNLKASELKYVIMGLEDTVRGKQSKVNLSAYGPKVNEMAQTRQQARADKEKNLAKPFLNKMAKEKGATVTSSGLIYTEIRKGKGPSPKATDKVKVHYHGTLRDGTVFDSSVNRGTPAEFPLNSVIPCWTEGVQKMKVGGKARLVCPASIAYGDRGAPPRIPGGAPLVFEVELLDILK